jgi:type II secretory pathway component PulK
MALLLVIFVLALLAIVVCGILQMNTEELQIMNNQVGMAQAQAFAEAGLQHALACKRRNPDWCEGFQDRPFAEGHYTVTLDGDTVTAVGRSGQGYEMRVVADITTVGTSIPRNFRVQAWRINP